MPDTIAALAQFLAPGALPAVAIVWAWSQLDKRITVLEARWELLWDHHQECKK